MTDKSNGICQRGRWLFHEPTASVGYVIEPCARRAVDGSQYCAPCRTQALARVGVRLKAVSPLPRQRKTHCLRGHELTGAGVPCRECTNLRGREYRAAQKVAA